MGFFGLSHSRIANSNYNVEPLWIEEMLHHHIKLIAPHASGSTSGAKFLPIMIYSVSMTASG